MTHNRLDQETSPYLLQHKDNPVHWQPWDDDALEMAAREDRPILLSVGYAACHWCHVMAHESFETPEIAALMNAHFVNIKIDREERPDLDAIYQNALALMGEQGGWPLTMFLTPRGEPFWGGTYFPPVARWGRPAFPEILTALARLYREEREKITSNVTALGEALAQLALPKSGPETIPPGLAAQIAQRLAQEIDATHGGIGGPPKFPQVPILRLIWNTAQRRENAATSERQGGTEGQGEAKTKAALDGGVILTLDKMSLGGIYDHLGGGFARYATDARWLVPHFEKMLYDNAQLVDLLCDVWRVTRSSLYAERIAETIDWLGREMTCPEGAFAASLDADSEGEEGKFYVWDSAEIDAVLGEEAAYFKTAYGVTEDGNWDGKTILELVAPPGDTASATRLRESRDKLLAARAARVRPGCDDKILADWNGLTIAALAKAATVFGKPAWRQQAVTAFEAVVRLLGEGERLYHAWRGSGDDNRNDSGSGRRAPGTLDDYAQMARAALALYESGGETVYLDAARRWAETVERHFAEPQTPARRSATGDGTVTGDAAAVEKWTNVPGGYFMAADDTPHLIVRPRSAADNALPSGNGTMVEVLARLYHLTGEDLYRQRAEAVIAAFSGELGVNFVPLATLVSGALLLTGAVDVVLVPPEGDAAREKGLPDEMGEMIAAAWQAGPPEQVVHPLAAPRGEGGLPGGRPASLPKGHPAHGKTAHEGRVTAYLCRYGTCSTPIVGEAALARALGQGRP